MDSSSRADSAASLASELTDQQPGAPLESRHPFLLAASAHVEKMRAIVHPENAAAFEIAAARYLSAAKATVDSVSRASSPMTDKLL